jgi:hypothetical protein
MNTSGFKITAIALCLIGQSVLASNDDQIDYGLPSSEAPSWTAGGHYTAELDLSANQLTLLPLDGPDIALALAPCAQPNNLLEGVYLLTVGSEQTRLITTHPQSALPWSEAEQFAVRGCNSGGTDSVQWSAEVEAMLRLHSVGAIYVKR